MRLRSALPTTREMAEVRAVTQQLNDGVRMLQSQAHNKSGTIELCHTSCVRLHRASSCGPNVRLTPDTQRPTEFAGRGLVAGLPHDVYVRLLFHIRARAELNGCAI